MSNGGEDFGRALLGLVQLVFSPLFPLLLISLCGLSWVLAFDLNIPQLGLWAAIAGITFQYVGDPGASLALLAGLCLFAIFLGWVAFREHAAKLSGALGGWVRAVIVAGALYWMVQAWPYDRTFFQYLIFGLVLFVGWASVCEAMLDTLKLIAINRPQPGPEVVFKQKALGDSRVASESEVAAILKSGK